MASGRELSGARLAGWALEVTPEAREAMGEVGTGSRPWVWLLCFGDFLSALLSGQGCCCTVPATISNFLKQSEHCPLVEDYISCRDLLPRSHLEYLQVFFRVGEAGASWEQRGLDSNYRWPTVA